MQMNTDYDTILTETIARHFDGAQIDGNEVNLGVAGLHIACKVNGVSEIGEGRSASIFFHLWGGQLGDAPIFASMSGYGSTPEEAIVTGGCNWACVFGPVLEAALSGKDVDEADSFEVSIHGRKYVAVVDGLDRAMFYGGDEEGDVSDKVRAARTHLGAEPWLFTKVTESGTLPVLPLERAVVLSVFCWESADQRTLEVKVSGADWLPSGRIFDDTAYLDGPGAALLREFIVLVPKGKPTKLSRELLARTLGGAEMGEQPAGLTAWQGWGSHGGQLGEPANEIELKRLEAKTGALPADYRDFLLEVQSAGAGPGYGLISPFSPRQQAIAVGSFDWQDGEEPQSDPAGVLVLAHAGCGVMWLLIVTGQHRGEVWVDAAGSDALARRVAPSFSVWFHDWLDALVRHDDAFYQWNANCCATPSLLSQLLDSIESKGIKGDDGIAELSKQLAPGAIGLTSGGSAYFEQGEVLSPCEPCSKLVIGLGVKQDVFKPGVVPKQARASEGGSFGRFFGRTPS